MQSLAKIVSSAVVPVRQRRSSSCIVRCHNSMVCGSGSDSHRVSNAPRFSFNNDNRTTAMPLAVDAGWPRARCCPLSTAADAAAAPEATEATPTPPDGTPVIASIAKPFDDLTFEYPKVKDLLQRISSTLKTEDDIATLTTAYTFRLGRYLREREFYFDGMGGHSGGGGGGAGGAADDAPVVEAKTIFDVKLLGFDAKSKIKVIKEIRSLAGLGLKEAKELVDGAPCTVMKGLKTESAEEMKAKLVELGAEVEIV